MIRKVNDLGQVVIPLKVREQLGINSNDKIYFEIQKKKIVLTVIKED